ncbi:MAG: hypothetical protein J5802_08740 [Butyrivibrio sp.]|nr:hypothetical protein [Butyrivibrio sp.]
MRKFNPALILILIVGVLVLSGCQNGIGGSTLDVSQVTYLCYHPDVEKYDMYVISSDCTVQHYEIRPDTEIVVKDLFEGKLPTAEEYTKSDGKISAENWDKIVKVLSDTKYVYLPSEIAGSDDLFETQSYYVEIKVDMIKHLAGGIGAGSGSDKNNKKFKRVLDVIEESLESDI